jgi:hypothetical protein
MAAAFMAARPAGIRWEPGGRVKRERLSARKPALPEIKARSGTRDSLVLPETIEAARVHLSVACGVGDLTMS